MAAARNNKSNGVDVSFRNGDAFDLLEEVMSSTSRPSLASSKSLPEHDDGGGKHPGYSNESFRNLEDAIAEAMRNSLCDVAYNHDEGCSSSTLSRQSLQKSSDCVSFRNLDDALQTAMQNSLSEDQRVELRRASRCRSGKESLFESFQNLDNAIQLAVIKSMSEMEKGELGRRLSVLSEESNDLDAIEVETVRSATKDLDGAVERASQLQEMRKHGCSSMQSLRDLKSAMQASMEIDEDDNDGDKKPSATHAQRGERRRSLLDDLLEEGAERDFDLSNDFVENNMVDELPDRKCAMSEGVILMNDPDIYDRRSALSEGDMNWKQYGCDSLQSYRNLKTAMALSNMEQDQEVNNKNAAGPVRRRSIIDELLDENSDEMVQTFKPQPQRRPSSRQCGGTMHASHSGIPSHYDEDLERAMHASLKYVRGGLSDSFRRDLVGLNGDLDEDEAFARAMQMSKDLDVAVITSFADENEVEGVVHSAKAANEQLLCDEQLYAYCRDIEKQEDHPDFDDNLLQIDTIEPSPHTKKRTTRNKRMFTILAGLKRDNDKYTVPSPSDDFDEQDDIDRSHRIAEEAQLKKASVDEDPIILMDNLTAKKEKKKKSRSKEHRGSGSKKPYEDETCPTSGMEKKPSLDDRIRIKTRTSSGAESGLDDSRHSVELTLDERIALKKVKKKSKDKDGKAKRKSSSTRISSLLKKSDSSIDTSLRSHDGRRANSTPQDHNDETDSPARRVLHRHSSPQLDSDAPIFSSDSRGNPHENTPTMHDSLRGTRLEDDPITMVDNMMDGMKVKGSKEPSEPKRKTRGVKNLFKL